MNLTCMEGEGASTHLQDISRRVARIFRGGGGCVWAVKTQTCRGSGGMLPRENFRIFRLPWTPFRAFP